jgi:hypothetical protein
VKTDFISNYGRNILSNTALVGVAYRLGSETVLGAVKAADLKFALLPACEHIILSLGQAAVSGAFDGLSVGGVVLGVGATLQGAYEAASSKR